MPFDPSQIPPRLIEATRRRRLVPFVGAGVSKQSGGPFPSWTELLGRISERAVRTGYLSTDHADEIGLLVQRGQYLLAAEALRYSLPTDEFLTVLEQSFPRYGVKPAQVHRDLVRLGAPVILTTNYDTLLEDAFAAEYQRAPLVVTHRDAPKAQRVLQSQDRHSPSLIFKIHGSIDDAASMVLSEKDYRTLIYGNPGYRLVLSAIFLHYVVLFVGFSFSDPELRLLLENHREALKHINHPDIIFLPKPVGEVERRRLREDYGLEAILYEPSPDHRELRDLVAALAAVAPAATEATEMAVTAAK